jgi:hypothetical protein
MCSSIGAADSAAKRAEKAAQHHVLRFVEIRQPACNERDERRADAEHLVERRHGDHRIAAEHPVGQSRRHRELWKTLALPLEYAHGARDQPVHLARPRRGVDDLGEARRVHVLERAGGAVAGRVVFQRERLLERGGNVGGRDRLDRECGGQPQKVATRFGSALDAGRQGRRDAP